MSQNGAQSAPKATQNGDEMQPLGPHVGSIGDVRAALERSWGRWERLARLGTPQMEHREVYLARPAFASGTCWFQLVASQQ